MDSLLDFIGEHPNCMASNDWSGEMRLGVGREHMSHPRGFSPGDRVLVTGGYDMEPEWLNGGDGYIGTLTEVTGASATVELDTELELKATDGGWLDFGGGGDTAIGRVRAARGRWLAVTGAWEGHEWSEPIGRLHVALCRTAPDLAGVPEGGGIGVWIESHATMRHVE
jgi:hypothetical protein